MKSKLATQLSGLFVFFFSITLYTLTLEPTTSFWDCSEFILSAAKLEVNHPAGAPLYMLLGRLFTLLSFGNTENIAWSINFMSGFFSALTIFFLYHVIVKLLSQNSTPLVRIGSAALGALTFAVSDSFWFSAVEGEVYALSMFFLILSFWAALKWKEEFEHEGDLKWLLFLALITGLGIGVHLLNLLVLPSVVLIVGFRKYGYSLKNMALLFGAGVLVLLGILYVLTPAFMKLLAAFDLLFVNTLKMPLHTGSIAGLAFIGLLFSILLLYFRKYQKTFMETLTLVVLFVLIGFSVYSVNIIRSAANPPVNFGRPNTIYSLIDYLNREQYPKRPLLYGQNYNSPVIGVNERYSKTFLDGQYRQTELPAEYDFEKKTCTWFPRMSSREERHITAYNSWVNIKGKSVNIKNRNGQAERIVVPNFTDQVAYFIKYQFAYMFGRYFMWNFVGRQNDRQGRGEVVNGNWISGFNFIDNARLGPQGKVPDWLKNNRARNTYFFLPLLFGLFGAWYQYKNMRELFFVVLALFIMGSLGLCVYINEVPITPRERDYVFVPAFLAFSIWIGMSFWAIAKQFEKWRITGIRGLAVAFISCLIVPALILYQNFDDHNRANRYAARDFARNILNSCPQNTVLFTSGDNDTYPLLYCQEVEQIRTDVRIVIMPFLAANWFLDGLRDTKYDDRGLKMTLPQRNYDYGKLDYVPVLDKLKRDTSWREAFKFLTMEDENAKVSMNSGERVNFIPLTNLSFQIKAEDETGRIPVTFNHGEMLYKHQLAFWDIISSNAMERPICFASKYEAQKHELGGYLQCKGFVYQLTPQKSEDAIFSIGKANAAELYGKLMMDFTWGNINKEEVYVDWNTIVNFNVFQVRNVFNGVAELLLEEGESDKAKDILKSSLKNFPLSKIPHDVYCVRQWELMLQAGMNEAAEKWMLELEKDILQSLAYYKSLAPNQRLNIAYEVRNELTYLNQLAVAASKFDMEEKQNSWQEQFGFYYQILPN